MDFISHALWGGISFGRRSKKAFCLAAGLSVMPDFLTEGLFFILYLLGVGGMPGWEKGHPNISDYPLFAQNLYNITHSLIIFVLAFVLIWLVFRRPVWVVAAWGLHIVIDIPTHSLALFPTPFLWPISSFRVNGIGWDNPIVLGIDIVLLITGYSFWLFPRYRRKGNSDRYS
jgi:membrane-bound metal-dependent hydrolase YbcI (DUF457 family)